MKNNINKNFFFPLLSVYGDQETAKHFTEDALFNSWLKVEVALADAQAKESIIPINAAEKIEEAATFLSLDSTSFWDETRKTGYPIVPLVKRLSNAAGESGKYVHWGATTQDIMDTGLVLQLKPVLARLEQLLIEFGDACATLCEQHANTVQAGRTHGQQAVPITFGFKVSVWLEEIKRHINRLQEIKKRLLVGQLSGAAGTLATLGVKAPFVRRNLCTFLDLSEPEGPWHVARDVLVEFSNIEALISGTVQKIAKEIAYLSSTEVGELNEYKESHRGASSTMPQKSNPISSETVIGLTITSIAMSQGLHHAMTPSNERATGEWQVEWDALPIICIGTAGSLSLITENLNNIMVNTDKMKKNLKLDNGLIMSESIMMLLANKIGKQKAHDLMYRVAQKSKEENRELKDVLEAEEDVRKLVKINEIENHLDPAKYIGEASNLAQKSADNWNLLFSYSENDQRNKT